MAFEGDLSNLGLGDVLQAIAMSRQVGTFILRGEDERRLACGPQGVALLSSKKSLGLKIGSVLVGTGKITQAHLDQTLKLQSRRKDMLLGQLLVETGACSAEDVKTARRYLAAEEIFGLFLWKEGQFEFQNGEPEMSGPFADLWFDVSSLAMEAARRIDEMPRVLAAVPAGEVFVSEGNPDPDKEQVLESRDLARLYHLADGSRPVFDIVETFYRGRFDTLKGLQTLLEAGLIRAATKEEIVAAGGHAAAVRDFSRAARLFQRACALDPDDDGARLAMADALRDAGERRAAAEEMVRIGNARLAAGNGLPAIEGFRAALRLDNANAAAHEGLTHALAESGLVEEAAEAAHQAARLRIANGDYEGARRVAETGLGQRPGEPQLLLCLANAKHGLGQTTEALKLLDECAQALEKSGDDQRRLLDVYRRIVQLDPDRRDCGRRIAELQAAVETRKRRVVQRIAIGCGILVLAAVAVPLLSSRSHAGRIEKARLLIAEKHTEEAREILAALVESELTEDELIEKRGLEAQIDQTVHPPQYNALKLKYEASLDELLRAGTDAVLEEHLADGLASLVAALDLLEGPNARKLQALDVTMYNRVRAGALRTTTVALGHAATVSQTVATRITALCDRFTDDVWKHEDLDVLHDLIEQSSHELSKSKAEDWERVPDLVAEIVKRAQEPKDGSDRTTAEAAAAIALAHRELASVNSRALGRARRKELKEGYKSAYANGTQLERDGRIEEALVHYEKFLSLCEDLRQAQPQELFAPIVAELLGGEMQLDQRIRTSRDRLAAIVRDSDDAQKSEAADEIEQAFRIRKSLVQQNPDLDLSRRFQMPLRIETMPPGAEVFLEDGSPAGRPLGHTPVVTTYPVNGGARYTVRMEGYRPVELVRKGAVEDAAGVERVELPKNAAWTSKPGGMTESVCVSSPAGVLTTSRAGVARSIDASTGDELARFEPGLLDGFAAPAVLKDGRAFVVALDGKGFVLDGATLEKTAEFPCGPVRGAPLPVARGVAFADETGSARAVDANGAVIWQRNVGKVRFDLVALGGDVLLLNGDAELIVLDGATGETRRRRALDSGVVWGAPFVRGSRVFLGNESGKVVCLDGNTLADAWVHEVDGPVRGRVTATEYRVVACTANGGVHVLDAETGAVLSRALAGGKVEEGACDLPDGGFVVVTQRGGVIRFDAKAEIVWKYDAGEDVSAPPALVGRRVIVTTRKGVVVALDP